MIPSILLALFIVMTVMMGFYGKMARAPLASPWANVILCLILGWSATGLLAAGNKNLANDLAILTFCAIGVTVLLALLGPNGHAETTSVSSRARTRKNRDENATVGPDDE